MSNRIALVHNGTLENFNELKETLIKDYNIEFRSETDTEVIV
jgi:glucosamine--fructose-6-phosphate aminotransferase (isomerizing)